MGLQLTVELTFSFVSLVSRMRSLNCAAAREMLITVSPFFGEFTLCLVVRYRSTKAVAIAAPFASRSKRTSRNSPCVTVRSAVRKTHSCVKVHESKFRLIAGEESLTEYQFHSKTARHFFCKVCGIYPFHRKRVTPDNLGINVFCLQGFDPTGIPVRQAVGAAML